MKNKKLLAIATVAVLTLSIPGSMVQAASFTKTDAKKLAQKYVPSGSEYQSTSYEDGEYEVKFYNKSKSERYSVDVKSSTKKIVSFESENINDNGSSKVVLSKTKANAKVTNELKSVKIVSTRLDTDDGLKEYDVKFSSSKYSGSYSINPETGLIIDRDINIKYTKSTTSTTKITATKAKSIALKKVPGATVIKCKLDTDDGRKVYEVDLVKGNYEYDLTIDATTGKILEYDKDLMD